MVSQIGPTGLEVIVDGHSLEIVDISAATAYSARTHLNSARGSVMIRGNGLQGRNTGEI